MTIPDYHMKDLLKGLRGEFAAKIAEAWQVADSNNADKLETAFPHLFIPEPKVWTGIEIDSAPRGYYWLERPAQLCSALVLLHPKHDAGRAGFQYLNSSSTIYINSSGNRVYGPITEYVF